MGALNQGSVLDGIELHSSIADAAEKGLQKRRNAVIIRRLIIVAACVVAVLIANHVYNSQVMSSMLAGRAFRGTVASRDGSSRIDTTIMFSSSGDSATVTHKHGSEKNDYYEVCSYSSIFGFGYRNVTLTLHFQHVDDIVNTYSITVDDNGRIVLTDVKTGDVFI